MWEAHHQGLILAAADLFRCDTPPMRHKRALLHRWHKLAHMTTAATVDHKHKPGPAPTYGKRRFYGLRLEEDDADYLEAVGGANRNEYLANLVKADREARERQACKGRAA